METKNHHVNYLKKVTISLEMGTSAQDMNLSAEAIQLQFIYGTGAQGICLFEKALFEKVPGETIVMPVESVSFNELFGHLLPSINHTFPQISSFFLKSTIMAVDLAENREVVQAIADGTGSCACDCGCGCG